MSHEILREIGIAMLVSIGSLSFGVWQKSAFAGVWMLILLAVFFTTEAKA